MKAPALLSPALALVTASVAIAQTPMQDTIAGKVYNVYSVPGDAEVVGKQFTPAHGDLPLSAGVPAQVANDRYIEALARVLYYWGYPAVDAIARTRMWDTMKEGPGTMVGLLPGGPRSTIGCLADYLSPAQRWVASPNNDTFDGAGFADLGREPVVLQTPADVPAGHYWTIQITDIYTNVVHQLGSAAGTPGGKYLLLGPQWKVKTPDGFVDTLRVPTSVAGVLPRSFAGHTPEAKARALAVLNQMGIYPLSQDQPGQRTFDCEAVARNAVYPKGVTAEMIAADPEVSRPQWVDPTTFWNQLGYALAASTSAGPADAAMAEQAGTMLWLRYASPHFRELLDRVALAADADLHAGSNYLQVGVNVGNGWHRQQRAGAWDFDWLGRAEAALIYPYVNDFREAAYLIRGTDAKGALLDGRYRYTIRFPKGGFPPVDRTRGGFWSLTMYDKDYFMLAKSPNGRTNVGTAGLEANELRLASDSSLTILISQAAPDDSAAQANWLPAPAGQFVLLIRAYVPTRPILDASYKFPDVWRRRESKPKPLWRPEAIRTSPACGVDSARADRYRLSLKYSSPGTMPGASLAWSRELCAAHPELLSHFTPDSDFEVYVFTFDHAGMVRYAVVGYSARQRRVSEWDDLCFYDDDWKQLGVCLGF
jgi:hypothetical protein